MENTKLDADIQVLEKLGFEVVGEWILSSGHVAYRIAKFTDERNVLYSFVDKQKVLYVGKSTRSLLGRMDGYKRPGRSQRTNILNKARIFDLLYNGNTVEIYAFAPQEMFFYRGIAVNLAAGLEDWLIDQIRPPWNKMGVKRLSVPTTNDSRENRTRHSEEDATISIIWDRVKLLDGQVLKTLKQERAFRVLEVSPDRIRFQPSSGKGTSRSCSRNEVERMAELCRTCEEVTVTKIRDEWQDNQNTSYLAAILHAAMSERLS